MAAEWAASHSPVVHCVIAATRTRKDPASAKEYTAYEMMCEREDGEHVYLGKRYTEFEQLNAELKVSLPPSIELKFPKKNWFGNLSSGSVESRRRELQGYLNSMLSISDARECECVEKFFDAPVRHDWPPSLGALDLAEHDLPHYSAVTEQWHFAAAVELTDGRSVAAHVTFHRWVFEFDHEAHPPMLYAHGCSAALLDEDNGEFTHMTTLDSMASDILQQPNRLQQHSMRDTRLAQAFAEPTKNGQVALPSVIAESASCETQRLHIVVGDNTLTKQADGSYAVSFGLADGTRCDLTLRCAEQQAVRDGDGGLVTGWDGEKSYQYLLPRCEVSGSAGGRISDGHGFYRHTFGGKPLERPLRDILEDLYSENQPAPDSVFTISDELLGASGLTTGTTCGWTRAFALLEDGREIGCHCVLDVDELTIVEQGSISISADGVAVSQTEIAFFDDPESLWLSKRTFMQHPTRWLLEVPGQTDVKLTFEAVTADQEVISILSQPSSWAGAVTVSGTIGGKPVTGTGFVDRCGLNCTTRLSEIFQNVGVELSACIERLLPEEPDFMQQSALVGATDVEEYFVAPQRCIVEMMAMQSVAAEKYIAEVVTPVREHLLRTAVAWQAYSVLICCDAVGGDSRQFTGLMILPSLLQSWADIMDGATLDAAIQVPSPAAAVAEDTSEEDLAPADDLSVYLAEEASPWQEDAAVEEGGDADAAVESSGAAQSLFNDAEESFGELFAAAPSKAQRSRGRGLFEDDEDDDEDEDEAVAAPSAAAPRTQAASDARPLRPSPSGTGHSATSGRTRPAAAAPKPTPQPAAARSRDGSAYCHKLRGSACLLIAQRVLSETAISNRRKVRAYSAFQSAVSAAHSAKALRLSGLELVAADAIDTGVGTPLESAIMCAIRLAHGAPAAAVARIGAVAGGGSRAETEALGVYFAELNVAYQVGQEVGRVRSSFGLPSAKAVTGTLPFAFAMGAIKSQRGRLHLHQDLLSTDPANFAEAIRSLTDCGSLDQCSQLATRIAEDAWDVLDDVLDASYAKTMIAAASAWQLALV